MNDVVENDNNVESLSSRRCRGCKRHNAFKSLFLSAHFANYTPSTAQFRLSKIA